MKSTTRICVDPWVYAEVQPMGQLKACCKRPPYSSLLQPNQDLAEHRNKENIRALRQNLLDGELDRFCRHCHIRPYGSTETLRETVRGVVGPEASLQDPAPLQEMRLAISEACNLRCVYCAVSQPSYRGEHMSSEVFERAVALLPERSDNLTIDLNGHGETSFNPEWVGFARTIQSKASDATLCILSNFARAFRDDEVDVLARMSMIGISMDTVDDELLKAIRRKVVFSTIQENVERIRTRANEIGRTQNWYLSAGIYDKVIDSMEDLAWFAIDAEFNVIDFWNLTEYGGLPDKAEKVRSLSSLPWGERQRAVAEAKRVVDLLRSHGVKVNVAGGFLDEEPPGEEQRPEAAGLPARCLSALNGLPDSDAFEAISASCHPAIELEERTEGHRLRTVRGTKALAEYFKELRERPGGYQFEVKATAVIGDKVLERIRERTPGAEGDGHAQRRWWLFFTFQHSMILRIEVYADRAQARDAAGLEA